MTIETLTIEGLKALFKDLRISSRIEAGDGFCAVMRSDLRALLAAFDAQDGEAERLRAENESLRSELRSKLYAVAPSLALPAPAQAEPVCYCDTHGSRLQCEDAGKCAMTLDGKAIATKLAWRSTEYDPPADDEEVLMYCPCRDTPSNPERIELGVFRTSRGSQHSWATLWTPRPAFPTLAAPPPPAGEKTP